MTDFCWRAVSRGFFKPSLGLTCGLSPSAHRILAHSWGSHKFQDVDRGAVSAALRSRLEAIQHSLKLRKSIAVGQFVAAPAGDHRTIGRLVNSHYFLDLFPSMSYALTGLPPAPVKHSSRGWRRRQFAPPRRVAQSMSIGNKASR